MLVMIVMSAGLSMTDDDDDDVDDDDNDNDEDDDKDDDDVDDIEVGQVHQNLETKVVGSQTTSPVGGGALPLRPLHFLGGDFFL